MHVLCQKWRNKTVIYSIIAKSGVCIKASPSSIVNGKPTKMCPTFSSALLVLMVSHHAAYLGVYGKEQAWVLHVYGTGTWNSKHHCMHMWVHILREPAFIEMFCHFLTAVGIMILLYETLLICTLFTNASHAVYTTRHNIPCHNSITLCSISYLSKCSALVCSKVLF